MPCYLFTYHAFGTWMPDRKQGYVKRKQGILRRNPAEATKYRAAMKETIAEFESKVQHTIIDSIVESQAKQNFEVYYIATETTHVHALVAWRDEREWLHMRSIIKSSISRRLKHDCGDRTWLAEGASRKRVKDRAHFDHLVTKYLPNHRAWKWCPARGKFR
jgi:REP element-mobilizing transposase RayT